MVRFRTVDPRGWPPPTVRRVNAADEATRTTEWVKARVAFSGGRSPSNLCRRSSDWPERVPRKDDDAGSNPPAGFIISVVLFDVLIILKGYNLTIFAHISFNRNNFPF